MAYADASEPLPAKSWAVFEAVARAAEGESVEEAAAALGLDRNTMTKADGHRLATHLGRSMGGVTSVRIEVDA